MPEPMISAMVLAAEINRITSAAAGPPCEWMSLWRALRDVLPFTSAWLGVLDTSGRRLLTVAVMGDVPPAQAFIESQAYYAEVESSGVMVGRRPLCLRKDPRSPSCPCEDRLCWPPGRHEGLAVPLIAADGRPVGLLVLVTDATGHPGDEVRQVIGEAAPMIAAMIDPMTSIIGLSGLVADAASAAVGSRGAMYPLPGSPPHPLLASGSQAVAVASDRLLSHRSPTTFLCPQQGEITEGYLRITAISCPPVPSSPFVMLVIVSPAGDLHGLTRREIEVLGLVIDGATNRQIASTLFIAQRTVAAHLEHILFKLEVPSRTAAAVRSLELSLYVPPQLAGADDCWPLTRRAPRGG